MNEFCNNNNFKVYTWCLYLLNLYSIKAALLIDPYFPWIGVAFVKENKRLNEKFSIQLLYILFYYIQLYILEKKKAFANQWKELKLNLGHCSSFVYGRITRIKLFIELWINVQYITYILKFAGFFLAGEIISLETKGCWTFLDVDVIHDCETRSIFGSCCIWDI